MSAINRAVGQLHRYAGGPPAFSLMQRMRLSFHDKCVKCGFCKLVFASSYECAVDILYITERITHIDTRELQLNGC